MVRIAVLALPSRVRLVTAGTAGGDLIQTDGLRPGVTWFKFDFASNVAAAFLGLSRR
jgi:hypothetical protein